jgi:hypothetical protein
MKARTIVRTIVPLAAVLITSANVAAQNQDAVLSVTSGFTTQPGTANPLGGRALLLLKEGFAQFLTRTGMFAGPPGSTVKVSPLVAWAYSCRTDSPVCKQALYEARTSFASNTKTDMNGTAMFPAVPAGTYYVLVQTIANNEHLVWDLRVDLKAGPNSITLSQRNAAPLDADPARPKALAESQTGGESRPCQAGDALKPTKSAAPANSTLSVRGTGYVYTYTQTDRQTGQVLDSFTERGNFTSTTLYLLDEDADVILQRAGVEPGLLGSRLAMFTFLDAGTQLGSVPGMELLTSMFSQKEELEAFTKERQAEFECVMQAIRAHSVAEVTTDANAVATFPSVPAGTYYLFGRFYRITKPARGGGVLWNHQIQLKPGQNALPLSVDNAALK